MTGTLLLAGAMLAGADGSAPNRLTAAERAQGWQLLFDGVSSNGWLEITRKPFPASWAVEDGCLRTVPRDDGNQDIRTVDEFRSFELAWEWKLGPEGNSGVKYMVQKVDEWKNAKGRQARARGLEYQLAGDREPDAASDPRRFAGSLYSVIAPSPKVAPRVGEFNQSRLIVRGEQVEHWLNGSRIVSFELSSAEVASALRHLMPKDADAGTPVKYSGPVCLQNHTSEVWFRSIKIRRLE